MSDFIRKMPWDELAKENANLLAENEWLRERNRWLELFLKTVNEKSSELLPRIGSQYKRPSTEEAEGETNASEGVRRIAAERQRQIEEEGWTAEHDDEHTLGEMADAAACYATIAADICNDICHGLSPTLGPPQQWPWNAGWWKPSADRIRNLEKAGALIAAEIDRLERAVPRIEEAEDE